MTQQNPETNNEPSNTAEEESAPAVALNRAERRALAAGKKGAGGNSNLAQPAAMRGPAARATPAAAPRIQNRGAGRGK